MRRVLTLLLVCIPAVGLAHEGHEPLPTKGVTVRGERLMLSPGASQAVGLELGTVELAKLERSVHTVGSVVLPPEQQAYVSSLIPGRVEQVLVKPGETVRAGQTLARLSGIELEELQRELLLAQTDRQLATRLLRGHESAGEVIAGKMLRQSRTEARRQEVRFELAWQMLRAIGLADETIRRVANTGETVTTISLFSPIDGVVALAEARPGELVQPEQHLYHIVDSSRLWIAARVMEADAGRMSLALPVVAQTDPLRDEMFAGKVDHIALRLDRDRTLAVVAEVDNSAGRLRPGMFAQVDIRTATEHAVLCPQRALIRDGSTVHVLVRRGIRNFIRKSVIAGATSGGLVEIQEGLFPGDRVVTVGSHELGALFAHIPTVEASTKQAASAGFRALATVELPVDKKTFASAPIEGRVHRLLVKPGQQVKQGQSIAELESLAFRKLQLELLQARASLLRAQEDLEYARSSGATLPRRELWQIESERINAEQRVAGLRRELTLAGLAPAAIHVIERTELASLDQLPQVLPIRAPAGGRICQFDLVPGQVVTRHSQLFELHAVEKVWLRAYLFENDAAQVAIGQPVEVELVSDERFRAKGVIERINPVLIAGQRALSVWAEIDNPDARLKEGMAATVTIDIPTVARR